MEFHYRKVNGTAYLILGLALSIFLVYFAIIRYSPVYLYIGLAGIPSFFAFRKFYIKEKDAVIKITDSGVVHSNKGETTSIKWEDITKVEWDGTDNARTIIITDSTTEIVIGRKIEQLPSLIKSLKSKVGYKFDTSEIPLDLKVNIK